MNSKQSGSSGQTTDDRCLSEVRGLNEIKSIREDLDRLERLLRESNPLVELREEKARAESLLEHSRTEFSQALWFIHELVANPTDESLRKQADLFEDYIHEGRPRITPPGEKDA